MNEFEQVNVSWVSTGVIQKKIEKSSKEYVIESALNFD